MTFCKNCGADIEVNQKFCSVCGTKIEIIEQKKGSPFTEKAEKDTTSPSTPPEREIKISKLNQGILGRVEIDKEDIDEVANKAKKGLGAAWRIARKGISRGAEIASQGIEVAKDTIDEKFTQQPADQAQPSNQESHISPDHIRYCPNCGQAVHQGKFCNHCGHRLL